MKKLFLVVMAGLVFTMAQSLYAQTFPNESEYYPVSYPIVKIYLHSTGYMVTYIKENNLVRTFIPAEWFTNPLGSAELVHQATGSAQPRFVVYYRNGLFDHVRIFARRDQRHETWGIVPTYVDIDQYFRAIRENVLEP